MLRGTRRVALLAAAGVLVASALPAAAAHGQQQSGQQAQERRSTTDQLIDTPMEVDAAHDHQHGAEDGHLPGSRDNVKLIGRADIEGAAPERVADVSAFGNYAYLTVRDPEGCSDAGIAIMDISDPRNPAQVGFIEATEGSFPGEGSQVVDLNTGSFTGQVLVFNNEICAEGGEGGVSLWDVTDPANPVVLTAHTGDNDPGGSVSEFNQIHSSFAWQAGDQAYVVIVDNEETADVDIVEITDPTNPVFLSELDLNDFDVAQEELLNNGNFQGSFFHDVVVKQIDGTWTMLLSYWDGGWVLLNVNDPADPVFIDDFEYPYPDSLIPEVPFPEGNAHQAEFSPNAEFIIGTDEDFSPYRLDAFNITTGPNAGAFPGGEFGFTVPLATYPDGEINGPTIYGGLACPSNEEYGEQPPVPDASTLAVEPGEERILVALRGLCFFSEKVEVAQEAGYDAVVIANHHEGAAFGDAPDASFCGAQGHEFTPEIAAVCIGHRAFHLLFNTTPAYEEGVDDAPPIGTLGEDVQASALFDGWGYVRLLDRSSLEQIDAYAIDEALDPDFAFGFGDLSVHEVAVDPVEQGLAYLSYYSGGLRVIRYGDNGIREVGHYIHKNGNNFWGVETHFLPDSHRKLILASDRDSGLWIFKFTGRTDKRLERFVGRKANLSGAKEVPGPGDPDGNGTANLRLHANRGEVCYRLSWNKIVSPFAAHIHEGRSDVAGPVVVTLFQAEEPLPEKRRRMRACIEGVDRALVADIMKNPREYYVNVHNPEFPDGAIRGQLFNP